jgi:hypothetical protein
MADDEGLTEDEKKFVKDLVSLKKHTIKFMVWVSTILIVLALKDIWNFLWKNLVKLGGGDGIS